MDIFSNRDRPLPDVYVYDNMPAKLKGQLTHIVEELCDMAERGVVNRVQALLLREWGVREMVPHPHSSRDDMVQFILLSSTSTERILDLLELMLRLWLHLFRSRYPEDFQRVERIITEVNSKFRQAGFGYEFVGDRFIRIDSQLLHKEVVLPALGILSDHAYAVPNSEYRSAHMHFRHGRYAECLVDCCKAFESVMKVICQQKYNADKSTYTVSKLVGFLNSEGFFPAFMGEHFNQFAGMLTSTVNTVRNKLAGHGAGVATLVVPEEYAAFALHSTAADILLLTKLAR